VLVVAFHSGVPGFSGGFVGVDVFFVISGFLITGVLERHLSRSYARVFEFWLGRLRRLMPALLAVIAGSSVLALFAYSPLAQVAIGHDAIRAISYSLNVSFARRATDYFQATQLNSSLFLHTWSLGIEEQFYLVWPLIMIAVVATSARVRRSMLLPFTVAIGTVSFILNVDLVSRHSPWGFYGLQSRMWELGIGAVLAMVASRGLHLPRAISAALGWSGIAAIVASSIIFSIQDAYPGYRALVPTLGTAMVVAASSPGRLLGPGRALATSVMQAIGRRSYALYLWHWPLLVLVAARFPFSGGFGTLGAVAAACAFAVVTSWLIENPIRMSPRLRRSPFLTISTIGVATALIAAAVTGLQIRARAEVSSDPLLRRLRMAAADAPRSCGPNERRASCEYGDRRSPRVVVLVGDSHAAQWLPALDLAGRRAGVRILRRTLDGCPAQNVSIVDPTGRLQPELCRRFVSETATLLSHVHPEAVVLSGAAGRYLQLGYRVRFGSRRGLDAWTEALRLYAHSLTRTQVRIGLILDNPYVPYDPIECIARSRVATGCAVPRGRAMSPVVRSRLLEQTAVKSDRATVLDPASFMCNSTSCSVFSHSRFVFRDEEHVTAAWSGSVSNAFGPFLEALVADRSPTVGFSGGTLDRRPATRRVLAGVGVAHSPAE
jgi:peptidoglycan/LPS O-acetylase OafA/YrhL